MTAALLSISPMVCLHAQEPHPAPADLLRVTINNEISAASDSNYFMFRSRKQTPQGTQTKLFVQTRDATAAILLAINGQPLNAYQRRAEESRLAGLVDNPEELKKKQRQEKEDDERVNRIISAMPDGLLYEYEGTESGQPGIGKPGEALVRLSFRPNPKYDPPSRIEQVLTGMRGYVLIDPIRKRIAKIDGTLYKDVSFGWGILGHLDRGGHFHVEQGIVGDSSWEITRLTFDFTGRILLFKSLTLKSDEVFSDYHRVPNDLTFAQGVALLEKESLEIRSGANGFKAGVRSEKFTCAVEPDNSRSLTDKSKDLSNSSSGNAPDPAWVAAARRDPNLASGNLLLGNCLEAP